MFWSGLGRVQNGMKKNIVGEGQDIKKICSWMNGLQSSFYYHPHVVIEWIEGEEVKSVYGILSNVFVTVL